MAQKLSPQAIVALAYQHMVVCCDSGRSGEIEGWIFPGARKALTFAGKIQKWWKVLVSQIVLNKDLSSKRSER